MAHIAVHCHADLLSACQGDTPGGGHARPPSGERGYSNSLRLSVCVYEYVVSTR